jgi:hypothetical protein
MLPRMAHMIVDVVARYWDLFLLIALAVGLSVWLVTRRQVGVSRASRADGQAFLLILAAATLLLVSAMYIFQISPRHAMGAQYLMAVSPLLFMTGAMVFDCLAGGIRWRPVLILALVVYQAAYGGWTTLIQVRTVSEHPAAERPPAVLDSGSPILLDSVVRGVLPTVLWHVPALTSVYAAMQDDLLGGFPEIPADVRRLMYVSDLRYGNDAAKQGRVLEQLAAQGFRSVARRGSVYGVGEVFEVTR